MDSKSYRDLEKEVWDTGICARCGACVAVCPADALYFPHTEGAETPKSPSTSGYCKKENDQVECGSCYRACPRTKEAASTNLSGLGDYLEIITAKTSIPVRKKQSGGAVTAILVNALDEGLIDAVVTVTEDRWTLQPSSAIITSSEALINEAGSRYNWWVPLLAALKEAVVVRKFRKIAVVGLPCVVQAVSAIRESDFDLLKPYGDSIRLVIGLFCTESFDYSLLVNGKIRQELNIEPWKIRRMNIRGELEVTLIDDQRIKIPLSALEGCIPKGCQTCIDFTAVQSDISAGAIGSPQGYTTLIIRTRAGKGFVDHAVENMILETGNDVSLVPIERLAGEKRQRLEKNEEKEEK